MTTQFTHLLHRAARLRQRFEAERARERHNPFLLLRMRNLLLRLEQRMYALMQGEGRREPRLQPVQAMAPRGFPRG